jgi:hypothetical protein
VRYNRFKLCQNKCLFLRWARKMAVDAFDDCDLDEAQTANAIEMIFEQPEKLRDLDLGAFADELYRQVCCFYIPTSYIY